MDLLRKKALEVDEHVTRYWNPFTRGAARVFAWMGNKPKTTAPIYLTVVGLAIYGVVRLFV